MTSQTAGTVLKPTHESDKRSEERGGKNRIENMNHCQQQHHLSATSARLSRVLSCPVLSCLVLSYGPPLTAIYGVRYAYALHVRANLL